MIQFGSKRTPAHYRSQKQVPIGHCTLYLVQLCCTALYNLIQCNIVRYSKIDYNAVRYSKIQCSIVKQSRVQYIIVQYSTLRYSTVKYSTVQFCDCHTQDVLYNTVIEVQGTPRPSFQLLRRAGGLFGPPTALSAVLGAFGPLLIKTKLYF